MRFLIEVDQDWNVNITCPTLAGWNLTRQMRRVDDGDGGFFPLPPADPMPAEDMGHHALCLPQNAALRLQEFQDLGDRKIKVAAPRGSIENFGRYLFASLLGGDAWDSIVVAARESNETLIELALCWSYKERDLHRLNWELMHGPERFLAQGQQINGRTVGVAITRVVAESDAAPAGIGLPPRWLFVIGSSLNDPSIRAGAEFFGLLRQMKQRESRRGINSRDLQQTDLDKLKSVASSFRPEIVHFICHGDVDARGGYLLLAPKEGAEPEPFHAPELIEQLRAGGKPPAIIVLSACYSASVERKGFLRTSELAPLGAELVKEKAPVVIGMSGRISDDACRIFTRRFGEALLAGEPIIRATEEGRRAIFFGGHSPHASLDWAFPTIFLSPLVAHDYSPTANQIASPTVTVEDWIAGYDLHREPVFCARSECFAVYEALFNGAGKPVLGIFGDSGYGKTRVLQELSAQALRDGHIPVTLIIEKPNEAPHTPEELRRRLVKALQKTCEKLQLKPSLRWRLVLLDGAPEKVNPELDEEIQFELANIEPKPPNNQKMLTAKALQLALRLDLADVLAKAVAKHPALIGKNSKAIVVLDDIHEYDKDILLDLFNGDILGPYGLGDAAAPVPVVVTFRQEGAGYEILKLAVDHPKLWFDPHKLEAFKEDGEDMMAYQRVLLHPFNRQAIKNYSDKSWVINDQVSPDIAKACQDVFRTFIKGIPVKIADPNLLYFAVTYGDRDGFWIKADDEYLLRKVRGEE